MMKADAAGLFAAFRGRNSVQSGLGQFDGDAQVDLAQDLIEPFVA
jgi:hypothetical protein